jgi:hypothetical protein
MLVFLTVLAAVTDVPAATPPVDNDPIICTRSAVGSEVGTHMQPKKICMRKSDRDYIEREQRETIAGINNRGDDRMRFIPPPPRAAPAPKPPQ